MNSFEILRAKRTLIKLVRAEPDGTMSADEAVSRLRQAGHRVSRDVLEVLVRGSATSPLEITQEGVVRFVEMKE